MLTPLSPTPELISALQNHETILVLGHKNPDGDSLGSQLALASMLRRLGKTVHLLSPGPFERHEIQHLGQQFSDQVPELDHPAGVLVVVVDCSTIDRIGHFADQLDDFTVAVIDHHASGAPFGDITWINTRAFSVTFMIHQLYAALDMTPTEEEAQLLFFGLVTDTGYFRHVLERRGEVFLTAAALVEAGASPKTAYDQMYGSRPFASKKLLGLLLSRCESYYDGKLLVTWETRAEHETFGEAIRDSESLYAQLLGTQGCEAVLYIREDQEKGCTVGLRSKDYIDVSRIAGSFSGGGHRRAAGFSYHGRREDIQQELIALFEDLVKG